jgi:biotin carboxylase
MKLDNCAVNADFIMRDGKTYVLELGRRSGATCLAELVSIYYGYDYYKKIIQVALGEKPDFPTDKAVPNASKLLMSDGDGVISCIANRNPRNDSSIYEVKFDYTVGDSVKKFHVGRNRIGHVITKGRTLAEATAALDRALGRIEIEVS